MSSLPSDGLATTGASVGLVDTVELTVPDLGPSADRAVVVSWAKRVGERVAVDEPICRLAVGELEFEVHSTAAGELTRVIAAEGVGVLELSSLAEIAVAEQSAPRQQVDGPTDEPEADPGPPPERVESIRPEPIDPEFAPTDVPATDPPIESIDVQALDPEFAPAEAPEPAPPTSRRFEPDPPMSHEPEVASSPMPGGDQVDWSRWISPVVRALADERGIDLAQVRGTGIGGRIRKRDVLEHASSRPAGEA